VNDLPPSERDQRHSRLLRSDGAPADVAPLQTFIDACPGYALLVDEDHRIVLINQTACDELNLEPYQVPVRHRDSSMTKAGYCASSAPPSGATA
jgi:PAS domain-containing protein